MFLSRTPGLIFVVFRTHPPNDSEQKPLSGAYVHPNRIPCCAHTADQRPQKAYEKLQRNGVSFVVTSESHPPPAESLLGEFASTRDHGNDDAGGLLAVIRKDGGRPSRARADAAPLRCRRAGLDVLLCAGCRRRRPTRRPETRRFVDGLDSTSSNPGR
jgi:hypothetical protein